MRELNKDSINNPVITIVTIVFNKEKEIESTIQSVINQTYSNIEYIIIDGGSTDKTLNIVNKYQNRIKKIISEKDNGIYDAMNKGINLATGSWINFMNAGDKFTDNDVLTKLPFLSSSNNVILYGNKTKMGNIIYAESCDHLKYGEIMACHQSMFFNLHPNFKRSVIYKTRFLIYADYDLVNRLYLEYGNFKFVNVSIAISEGGGISSSTSLQKRKDKYQILYKSYGLKGIIRGIIFKVFRKTLFG